MILLEIFTGNWLIQFLIAVLVIAIVVYVVKLLFDFLGVPQPLRTIVFLILAVAIVIFLANKFFGVHF